MPEQERYLQSKEALSPSTLGFAFQMDNYQRKQAEAGTEAAGRQAQGFDRATEGRAKQAKQQQDASAGRAKGLVQPDAGCTRKTNVFETCENYLWTELLTDFTVFERFLDSCCHGLQQQQNAQIL